MAEGGRLKAPESAGLRVPATTLRACLRCGTDDLAMPGVADGIAPGGEVLSWVCRACGHQGIPATFDDAEALATFSADRQALFHVKPGQPPELPKDLAYPPRGRSWWFGGVAALVGFAFLSGAALLLLTAAQTGGSAWLRLGPSAVIALLLGVPFMAMAARKR
jgi:hypothetical protein